LRTGKWKEEEAEQVGRAKLRKNHFQEKKLCWCPGWKEMVARHLGLKAPVL
jgi:hypothetical protein